MLFMKKKFTCTKNKRGFLPVLLSFILPLLFLSGSSFGQITLVTGSQTNQQTSGTTLSVNKPTNLAVGDLMVAVIIQVDNGDNQTLSNATTGGAWTLVAGEEIGNVGSDSWWGTVLYKVATAADVAATNFSFTLDNDVEASQGGIAAFRGVAVTGGVSGGPLDVAVLTSAINSINTDDYSATAISTATANAMIVMLGMVADDRTASGWSTTSPGALTQIFSVTQAPTGPDMGIGMASALKSGTGSTGTGIAELSANENDPNGALLIALRPCTANPTITTTSTPQPASAVCFSSSSQTTTLAYTATTNSPAAFSIDWNAAANTAGLTDQSSTAFAFAGGGGTVTGINIPASVAAGTYSGTMYITTAAGCITSKTITLTINPSPTVNAGGALSAICQGGTSAALGGSVGGAATGGTWDDGGVGGTFNPDATTLNATWTPPGAYTGTATLTLTTSGGSCGTTSAFKTQLVNATPPAALLGGDEVICQVATTLAGNAAAPGTGTWTIPSGPNTSTAQITGGLTNASATFTPTTAGTYTLRWTITSGGCAATFDEIVYTVNALPQVAAFNGSNICNGDVGTLTATLSGATPFTVTYTPGLAEGGVVSNLPFNVVPNPGSPGTYNYTITSIQDANGCTRNSGFTDAAATINVSAPLTSITYTTTPVTYCPGVAIAANNATVGGGTATIFSVSPALPAGLTLNTTTGAITGSPTVYAAAADYTVTASNACGSVNTAVNITTDVPVLSTTPGERCGTGSVALSAASTTSCFASTINWFSAATGGSSLGTGTNFNTPSIGTNTNYFAEESFTSGESNTGGASASGSTNRGLVFDLFEDIVLRSVQVNNTSGTGSVTVALRNSSGGTVAGVSDVTVGSLANGVQTITLNWSIPAGSNYRILYTSGTRNLRRTDPYTFPETIGVGVIKGNWEGSLLTTRYNYFYNWVIARTRVSTLATVHPLPTITLGANPAVDRGTVNADLTYSATTGSPDEYSITWDAAALTAGFVNVVNAALPPTPIALTVPAAADASTYNGTLTLRNTSNGCISNNNAISVTVNKTDLNVTADDKNKIADGNVFTGFTSTITGFINGEDETTVSGTVTYSGTAVTATAIGSYTITPVVGGLSATNYNFIPVNGTLDIDPVSQANADFRSKTNGVFSAAGTWEYDLGGNNWTNASQPPASSNNVSITHDVTLDQDYTVGSSKNFTLGTGAVFTVNPSRTFSVAAGGTADFTGKAVTFQSDNSGTASLGQILGTLTGASNVTVERYIPNNSFRSWRLLSVPTYGNGQTIRQAWQEGDANPLPMQNNIANRGTQITGVFPSQTAAVAAGFDSTSVQASMLTWNGNNWNNVNSTHIPIANNKAYFLYIRGERSKGVTGAANNASATTLRTNGTIYTGDQSNNINAGSFAVVPNLYPSSIDFTGLTRTGGVSNLFYIWDSKKQNGNSLGIYQTFSGTNGFNCLISGGSYVLGQPNTTIESGQAFFVQASNSAGTIVLKETAKTNGSNGNLGLRPSTPASALVKIDTRLYETGGSNMLDANAVVFDAAYSNAVDGDDAPKFTNPGENIGIQKGNIVLAVEGRQPVAANDVIQFKTWNLQQQAYRLELAAGNMAAQGVSAMLEDAYLQTSTPIDLTGTTTINFTVDANTASAAVNRFRIVFRQLAPVPVNFVSITGHRTNNGVKIDWKSASERGIKEYVVERSLDGMNFTAVGKTAPLSNNAIEISYSFTDAAAPSPALMYRIKSQGVNNEIRYSPVAKVNALNVKAGFLISPNPVENSIVNLQFNAQQAGKYNIRIVSAEGKTVQFNSLTHPGGSSVQNINLTATIARGTYTVEIIAPDNKKTVQTLFVNKN